MSWCDHDLLLLRYIDHGITMMSHGHHGISSHWPLDCLFNSFFWPTWKESQRSASLATGGINQCPVDSPHKWSIIWKTFQFNDITMGIMVHRCSTSHNAPFRTEMSSFLFCMEHCGIWNKCFLGFVKKVSFTNGEKIFSLVTCTNSQILTWSAKSYTKLIMLRCITHLTNSLSCTNDYCYDLLSNIFNT